MRFGPVLALCLLPAALAHAYVLKLTSSGAPVHWARERVEISIGPAMRARYGADADRAAQMAIDAWRGLGGPEIELSQGPTECTIELLADWPYDPRELAVTSTSYDDASGTLVRASIYVNAAHEMALLENEDEHGEQLYDLGAVLAHELGHFQGLAHTESDRMATMWARIGRGDTHQRTIEQDDELGLEAAYAGVSHETVARGGCGRASVAGPSTAGAGLCALFGAVALFAARRRTR